MKKELKEPVHAFSRKKIVLLPVQFPFEATRGGHRECVFVLWHFQSSKWVESFIVRLVLCASIKCTESDIAPTELRGEY